MLAGRARGPARALTDTVADLAECSAGEDDYLKRLRRIEGQARGIQRMVEEEQYCMTSSPGLGVDEGPAVGGPGPARGPHGHCVVNAAREGGPEAEIKLKEASDAIARLVRS